MITVTDLTVSYGESRAVTAVSLSLGFGEVAAVLGSNGAGKSSLGQGIGGLVPTSLGTKIHLDEQDLSNASADDRVKSGVVYVPEGRRVFTGMSVEDNLRVGAFIHRRSGRTQERMEEIFERIPRLEERRSLSAGYLSGGEQQLLAIARALMSHPKVLLLDEPSLGLSPKAIADVSAFLLDLCTREEIAVLILEQNISFARQLAERAWMLQLGEIVAELSKTDLGDPDRVRGVMAG